MAFVTAENRRWWALATLSFSLFMINLDNTVVSLALPAIQADLEATLSQLAWVVDAYALVFAVLLLTAGKLADYVGRRLIFIAGLVVFTVSSLACALAGDGETLIAARAVQGAGAAMMLPATLSIISATFPVSERGKAIGIWAAVAGGALAIGPLIGGLLVEYASWEWIFYVNVPVGVLAVVATLRIVPESRDTSEEQRLDLGGLVFSGASIFLVTFALIEANDFGWTSATILLCFAGAAVSLAAFVVLELRLRLPMLDLSLFRNPTFAGANVGGVLLFIGLFAYVFFISIYLQNVLRYSVIEAGGTFLVTTLAVMITAPIAGILSDKTGPRWLMAAGMAIFGFAMIVLSTTVGVDTGFWAMFPWFAIGGFGFGLVMPPMTAAILGAVHMDKAGVASGVMQAFRQLGGGLGIAIMGAIVASHVGDLPPQDPRFAPSFVVGFQDVLLLSGLLALASSTIAAATIRKHEELQPHPAAATTGGGAA
jgi:EmrB/QacA subfamily drug resistance transporter